MAITARCDPTSRPGPDLRGRFSRRQSRRLARRRCRRSVFVPRTANDPAAITMPKPAGFGQELALGLSNAPGAQSSWREGRGDSSCRALRAGAIRVAHRDDQRADLRPPDGCSWKGRTAGRADQNTGFRRSPTTSPSIAWSIARSCAGASSAIIRNSSRRSGFGDLEGRFALLDRPLPSRAPTPAAIVAAIYTLIQIARLNGAPATRPGSRKATLPLLGNAKNFLRRLLQFWHSRRARERLWSIGILRRPYNSPGRHLELPFGFAE